MPFPLSVWFAAALALAPAIVAWWTGRTVLARADDPVLPELLWQRRQRLAGFALGGAIALALLFVDDVIWALPLLWIALLLSGHGLRRSLFGERLGTFAYLRYAIFSAIGSLGVWLLAVAAPALVATVALSWAPNDHALATRIAAAVAVVLAAVIALWQHEYTRVFVALHRGTPLRSSMRPELFARLEAVLDRAAPSLARRPESYRFGAPGAYVMNAFAIPSRAHPAIALGDTLLATLTDDEIVAVFAHEVAHHEQFNSKQWRRARWRGLLLIVLIALLPVYLVAALPAAAMALSWCMPVIILATLGRRARRRQAETESDLRAIALGGTAQALIGALTKLHVYSRVPRRWPHAIERAATHPSLARRIQALREATSALEPPEPQIATPLTAFRSRNPGEVVAFDRDRAYWFEGVPVGASLDLHDLRDVASSYRALAYADLTELHVAVADGDRAIEATDRDGRSWRVPIAADDVAAVQATLDRVDVKLGRRRVAVAPAGASLVRWLALALLVMLSAAGELGIALVPILIILVRPTMSAAIAATAALTIAQLLVALRLIAWADPVRQIALLLALSVAIVLVVQTARRVRADTSRGNVRRLSREAWVTAGVLAAIAVLMTASLWTLAARPTSLLSHPAAIGAAAALFAAGGALLTIPSRWWRVSGALTSVAALGAGTMLSGDGWLVNRTPPLTWTSPRLTATGAVRIAGGGLTLVASPHGEAFAVSQYQPARRGEAGNTRYVIGRFRDASSVLRTSSADKIVFVDDTTLVALDSAGDSLEVRAERVSSDKQNVVWRQHIPAVASAELLIDRARGRWIVVGRGQGDASFVVETGQLEGGTPQITRAGPSDTSDVGEIVSHPLAAFADGGAIWTTLAQPRGTGGTTALMLLAFTGSARWELHGVDRSGEHFLLDAEGFPACGAEVDAAGALCVERSASASRIWRAASARSITRVAALPPFYDLVHADGADRVAAAERFGQRAIVVDVSGRRGVRVTIPGTGAVQRGVRWTADIAARGDYLLVLSTSREGALVTRYAIR